MQEALKVSDLNNYLKSVIENDFILNNILVRGEISNFKQYSQGGQWYFTLKDETSQINCVVFENFSKNIKFQPEDGAKVIVKGKVSVFNRKGTYNLQVFWMDQEVGQGDLAKAFESLKQKLQDEGFFAAENKKKLPAYPQKIAVLAALEGAAVQDIVNIASRRDPGLKLSVFPTIVQGADAVRSIVQNIKLVNELDEYDVLILARGGGSLEDLWAFNEEPVARAIFGSNIPTVSAIGHEVDFTIADFVADLRAPTPSAAAELVIPDRKDLLNRVAGYEQSFASGLRKLITDQYQQLDYFQERLKQSLSWNYQKNLMLLQNLSSRLEELNPLAILNRGYGIVKKDGKAVQTAERVAIGDIIDVVFAENSLTAKVLGTNYGQKI